MMTRRPFGKTGFDVSVLGFGAAPAAFLKSDAERAAKLVNSLLDRGVNLIDTAVGYPGSEEFLGQHIGHRRGDYFLVSKCGNKDRELQEPAWSSALIAKQIDRSLALLKTDHLDCMLLHSCDLATLKSGEAWQALRAAKQAGKIRFCGYSGDNDAAAYAVTSLPDIAVLETSINIVDQINIDEVLPSAREANVGVIAKRPIANGAWKGEANLPGMYKGYAKTYIERFAKLGVGLEELGLGDVKIGWPEVALRFTLAQPGVSTAIVGTTDPENANRNIEYVARGPLPEKATAIIREAYRKADPKGEWSGQT